MPEAVQATLDAGESEGADAGVGAGAISAALRGDGFAFVDARRMAALLDGRIDARLPQDWDLFVASWNDLGPDRYMADGGRYRKRRHAAFAADASSGLFRRKPDQPHYQSRDYNSLNGGVARWFTPMQDTVAATATLHAILQLAREIFVAAGRAAPPVWHVELHQFRIEAQSGEAGLPTPEGMHRDGVDWVLVLLIARENVASGQTTISADTSGTIGAFTLTEPLDAAFVDDHRVQHGVTPITPLDPARPAWRDVLVATFRHE